MLTRAGGDILTEDALGNIAREMVLTEAIIRRLASRYDVSLLRAMHVLGPLFLEDEEKTKKYAAESIISMSQDKFDVKYNPEFI